MATTGEIRVTKTISNHVNWISAPIYVLVGYIILALLILTTGYIPFRVVLATILAFFGSGYSLLGVLYRDRELDAVERLALSFCLSQAVGGMLGFILARSIWGLRLLPLLIGTSLFNLGCYMMIVWQRRNRKDNFSPSPLSLRPVFNWWRHQKDFEKMVTAMLILSLVTSAWTFYRSLLVPKLDPAMTEFYITDSSGLVEEYPLAARAGETLSLYYGAANRENDAATYQVEVYIGNKPAGETRPFELNPGDSQQESMEIRFPEDVRGLSRIDFILRKSNTPYRFLHLWIEINGYRVLR